MINLRILVENEVTTRISFLTRKNDIIVFKEDSEARTKHPSGIEIANNAAKFAIISTEMFDDLKKSLIEINQTQPQTMHTTSLLKGSGAAGGVSIATVLVVDEIDLNIDYQHKTVTSEVDEDVPVRLNALKEKIFRFEDSLQYQNMSLFDKKEELKTRLAYQLYQNEEKKGSGIKFKV
jgi:hypothetical protein